MQQGLLRLSTIQDITRRQWAVLFVFVVYVGIRLFWIYTYGDIALGYDIGIYKRIIETGLENWMNGIQPPFAFTSISNGLQVLHDSTDTIMYGWYMLFSVLMFFGIYYVAKLYFSKDTAFVSIVLFGLSSVQFEFFWWYYYRNFIAVFLVLLMLILFKYRSYLISFPLIVLGSLHPISAVPVIVTLAVIFIFDKKTRRFLLYSGIFSGLFLLLLNWREYGLYINLLRDNSGLVGNLSESTASEWSGQFLSLYDYARYASLSILFGFFGMVYAIRKKDYHNPLFYFFCTVLVIILFQFVFYRRMIIYADILLMMYAGFFVSEYARRFNYKKYIIVSGMFFVCVLCIQLLYVIRHKEPLISKEDFNAISELNSLPSGTYVLSLSSEYAPWIYGFTTYPIIAPGMFEYNLWNEKEWRIFWSTENSNARHLLLDRYDENIYIFTGSNNVWFDELIKNDTHFIQVQTYIWKYSHI